MIFALFLLLFVSNFFYAIDIGSDTAVTRFNSTVVVNNGDRIAGFAWLTEGFNFAGSDVVATFDSFFPVSGDYALTGGTLILNRDLIFQNILRVGFLGNIIGNGHVIQWPDIPRIPSVEGPNFRCSPFFVSSIDLVSDAETLSWNDNEQFLATASDDGLVRVYELVDTVITFVDDFDTVGVAVDGVGQIAWRPGQDRLALAREAGSAQVWTLDFNGTTLSSISSVVLAGDGRACAWHPSGDYLAVGTDIAGSEIIIYPVNAAGVIDTVGALTFDITPDRAVQYECLAWDTSGTYLAIGLPTNAVDPEFIILEFDSGTPSIVGINASISPILGRSVAGLDWGKGPNYLVIGLEGTVGDNVQVYEHDDGGGGVGNGSLTFLDGASDLGRTTEGVSWESTGECFSASTDELAGLAYFNTYNFDGTLIELISSFEFTGLAAGQDFEATRWGPNGRFAAVAEDGPISGGTDGTIRVYALPVEQCYFYSNVTLRESSNTLYEDICLTFTGECVWDGRGVSIDFGSTATVFVAAESSLRFDDITISGIEGTNVMLLDHTSTLTLNNTTLILDQDYNFNIGHLVVMNEVTIKGDDHSFILSSPDSCTIMPDARLFFDKNTTFRYAPSNG